MFRKLSRIAYHRATRIVTLSEANRQKEIVDGAPGTRSRSSPTASGSPPSPRRSRRPDSPPDAGVAPEASPRPLRVGFVGRVVPIKDVVTFIKACDLAARQTPLDVRIIGPDEEDPAYAARCRGLVETLGRQDTIRFLGPRPPGQIYADLDVVVLTSFSEGQPLVILEAYAAGIPVIATDVGACRELVEGRSGDDRQLGPSGFVTRVAVPEDTAAALVRLAADPGLRRWLGEVGRQRVTAYYQRADMVDAYRALYQKEVRHSRHRLEAAADDRPGSLTGTVGAYLTGVAVTSAPWLLTTAVLTSLRVAARAGGTPDFLQIERLVTLIYALTVVVSAPIHVVVSRTIADRLYDRKLDQIAAPLWRAVGLTLIGFTVLGTGLMAILRVPFAVGAAGAVLTVIVGTQWLLLSVGAACRRRRSCCGRSVWGLRSASSPP